MTLRLTYDTCTSDTVVYQVKEFITCLDGTLVVWVGSEQYTYAKPLFISVTLSS